MSVGRSGTISDMAKQSNPIDVTWNLISVMAWSDTWHLHCWGGSSRLGQNPNFNRKSFLIAPLNLRIVINWLYELEAMEDDANKAALILRWGRQIYDENPLLFGLASSNLGLQEQTTKTGLTYKLPIGDLTTSQPILGPGVQVCS